MDSSFKLTAKNFPPTLFTSKIPEGHSRLAILTPDSGFSLYMTIFESNKYGVPGTTNVPMLENEKLKPIFAIEISTATMAKALMTMFQQAYKRLSETDCIDSETGEYEPAGVSIDGVNMDNMPDERKVAIAAKVLHVNPDCIHHISLDEYQRDYGSDEDEDDYDYDPYEDCLDDEDEWS